MSDKNDPQKPANENQEPERRQRPSPPPPSNEEKTETISLLDLMREVNDEPASLPDSATDEGTITLPPIVPPPARDDSENTATLTGVPISPQAQPKESTPPPLITQPAPPPRQRPPVHDQDATEVQPRVAFPGQQRESTTRRQPEAAVAAAAAQTIPRRSPVRESQQPRETAVPAAGSVSAPPSHRNWSGCIVNILIFTIIAAVVGVALVIGGAAIGYSAIARTLPPPSELQTRASNFETVRIYDRNGNLLYAQADPNTGNRIFVPLSQISPHLVNATIATEDARFYENPGFDILGISRAVLQAAQEGEFVSGASTITQQLVRAVLLEEDERAERTFRRKVREIILAAEISRTYEKDEILQLYLNEIYYGNLAYGIEAAAQTYFNKPASELTLTEATLLAGLPQAPALWDPYTAPEKALGRQSEVLSLMVAEGFITVDEARAAQDEARELIQNMTPPAVTIEHPHFSLTVLQQAEDILGAQSIYRGGLRIYTTLDSATQNLAEQTIASNQTNINAAGANNAAMVVLQPNTGEILALVGSVDFDDESISGQVNMALAPRQPGSTIKPLVYLAAMEKGWTPSTLIWDVPTQFPNGGNPPYEPKNYDDQFHGPLRLRPSLGNSYNIPAVKALEYVGVCNFVNNVQKLGLISLQDQGCAETGQPRNYGLSLALGGGEISALEMAGAFGTLANQGRFMAPYAISQIENSQGEILFEHVAPDPTVSQVVRPEHAFLMSDILSDNNARQSEFGPNSALVVQGQNVAAKTGTSGASRFDVRDAWTIGYSPEVVTAVWVGNTDNQPIGEGQSGTQVAAPIWNAFMSQYLTGRQPLEFVRPPGIVEQTICADSGTAPGENCRSQITEKFAGDQLPLDNSYDFIRRQAVDLWTNLRANNFCSETIYDANFFTLLVSGNEDVQAREKQGARGWIENTGAGQNWANQREISLPLQLPPEQQCDENTPRPEARITQPTNGDDITGSVPFLGIAKAPNFSGYQLEFGIGQDPQGWAIIEGRKGAPVDNGGLLANWDTNLTNHSGLVTVRVIVFGPDNPYTPESDPVTREGRVFLNLLAPTPTPTPTATMTPTPTQTPEPTSTPTMTATPGLPTATPTFEFIIPTLTPTPDRGELPTETPTPQRYP